VFPFSAGAETGQTPEVYLFVLGSFSVLEVTQLRECRGRTAERPYGRQWMQLRKSYVNHYFRGGIGAEAWS
jgi:hypothetical protein